MGTVFDNRDAIAQDLLKNQTCRVVMPRAGLGIPASSGAAMLSPFLP